MSEFDEIRNRIEREAEKKYPGYRGPRWGEWTPGTPSLLDNPLCTCNGSFDHAASEWRHHAKCPACGGTMSKQTIDSKGLNSTPFSHEDHINGDGSLLTAMAVTRDELAILAAHYQAQIDDYETDRERYPEDGISSREWNRYVFASRRLDRIKAALAGEAVYEGMDQ